MSIVVTGATGHLGRLVVEDLLERGIPAAGIVAAGRATERLADLAERGVTIRRVDFDDVASLRGAFGAGDRLLLVSGSELGRRVPQHQAVIDAAAAAGVALLVYTSAPRADSSPMQLVAEHRATEAAIAASGVPAVVLRNGWYFENYTDQLANFLEHGVVGAAGDGRVSAAARADFADAAAAVLTTDGHAGAVYELGSESFTLTEFAAALSTALGRTITYTDVPVAQFEQILIGAGVPAPNAAVYADADRGIAAGELFTDDRDLEKLIGRTPTPLADALARLTG